MSRKHTIAALLGALLLAALPPGTQAAPAEEPLAVRPGAGEERGARRQAAAPEPGVAPYLGTWVSRETVDQGVPGAEPYPVERYLLLRWARDTLKVKSVDYLPERRARGEESDWNGEIIVDRWNTSRHQFIPLPDGTLSVNFSGTNGIGPAAASAVWWATGRMTHGEDEEGPYLRLETTEGYAPSSKGNAWKPIQRTYRLVSREIDPQLARSRH